MDFVETEKKEGEKALENMQLILAAQKMKK